MSEPSSLHQLLRDRMSQGARVADPAGLQAMAQLDQAMGRPGQGAYVVQVLGTNGKGSTASLLSHLLCQRGFRVGLFSSPHLHRVHERIRIGSSLISDHQLHAICEQVAPLEQQVGCRLTFFELLTLAALVHFERESAQIIILEAGLGGRLDSTRVRESQLSLLTPIALDHQAILGPDLESIAKEKAAAFHAGAAVLCAEQAPELHALLRERCNHVGTSLEIVPPLDTLWPGLGADYQRQNAALALRAAAKVLAAQKCPPLAENRQLFEHWAWPGRMQLQKFPGGAQVIWDVAHNPHAVRSLVQSIQTQAVPIDKVIWFSQIDKDRSSIESELHRLKVPLYFVDLDHEEQEQEQVQREARDALQQSLDRKESCLVVGSHRLVAALSPNSSDDLQDPVPRTPFAAGKQSDADH